MHGFHVMHAIGGGGFGGATRAIGFGIVAVVAIAAAVIRAIQKRKRR